MALLVRMKVQIMTGNTVPLVVYGISVLIVSNTAAAAVRGTRCRKIFRCAQQSPKFVNRMCWAILSMLLSSCPMCVADTAVHSL